MSEIVVPELLRASAERSGFAHWLDDLPQRVDECVDRWSLRLEEPFDPGGQCAWVAPVVRPDGSPAVLKVGWRHPEAEFEAEALRAWDGRGAVRLFDSFKTDDTTALLIERCEPGTRLRDTHSEPEQDEVVARVLQQLWVEPPAETNIPPLTELAAIWSRDIVDGPFADDARAIFAELPLDRTERVVLCTDLHSENILAAERGPWLAVDPKPFVGDPSYDPVQHLLNCLDRVADDPLAVTGRIAALTGVDVGRLRAWLFARCVSELAGPDFDPAAQEKLRRIVAVIRP